MVSLSLGRLRRRGRRWTQQVKLFGLSQLNSLNGPIALIFEGLQRGVRLRSRTGFTNILATGTAPYQLVFTSIEELRSSGATAALRFTSNVRPRFRIRVVTGFNTL